MVELWHRSLRRASSDQETNPDLKSCNTIATIALVAVATGQIDEITVALLRSAALKANSSKVG